MELLRLMVFYDGVTAFVDKQQMSSTWNYTKHLILFHRTSEETKLKKRVFDEWTICWINNWLAGHTERVAINGYKFQIQIVTSRIPQGSVSCPSPFPSPRFPSPPAPARLQALLNMFADDITVGRFADFIKLNGAVNTVKGRSTSQTDTENLEKQTH